MRRGRTQLWAAAIAISVVPYGDVAKRLADQNPWRAFRSEDPILTAVRAEHLTGADCNRVMAAFVADRRQINPVEITPSGLTPWVPLGGDELDAVKGCDDFPCAVKFDRAEVDQMKAASKDARSMKFYSLVLDRARAYATNGTRRPYEFEGGIADPWALFEKRGLKGGLPLPLRPSLGERVLDFHQSRMRPVMQILDRRVAESKVHSKTHAKHTKPAPSPSPGPLEATVWVRDVYTTHYFDSWGEWGDVQCDPATHDATIVLAMSIELDLLKKTDLISSMAKGSMRDSVEKLARDYLDQWAGELAVIPKRCPATFRNRSHQ